MSSQSQTALLDRFEQTVGEVGLLEAGEQITVLDAMISRLQARQADAARRLEADGGLDGSGCKTVGSWLRLRLRRDAGAHRIARRAKMLVELPNVAAAFGAGQINDEHVDTLIAGMKWCGREAIVRHEQTLLQLCRDASAKELRQALEELAELEDPDRDEQRVKAHGERFFTLRRVGDLIHVDAMVEPSIGEALKTAVEAGAAPVAGDGRSLAQRRAEAFAELVLHGIGADTDPGASRLRPQVSLTVSLETLAGLGGPKPLLAHYGVVPTDTARRLCCDGALARVVLDTATGLPLDVGRSHRLATRRQRKALRALFRHCVFPGCTVPFRFCEIHHLDWWSRGGGTDLPLLLPYCWAHHHFLHEGGFTVTKCGDRLTHRRPDGQPLPDPGPPLQHALQQLNLDAPTSASRPPDEPRGPPRAA